MGWDENGMMSMDDEDEHHRVLSLRGYKLN